MPFKPPSPCGHPGCGALTHAQYCEDHAREYEQRRGSSAKRGYDTQWRKVRDLHLAQEPWCRFCKAKGLTVLAQEVDHIVPISKRPDLRLVDSNLRSLCKPCHSSRTARDQGIASRRGRGG